MDAVQRAIRSRQIRFKWNIERAGNLAAECERIAEENESLSNDIGMFSVVAAVGSLDEFIKSSTFDILFLYITNQWRPSWKPAIDGMVKSEPSKLINAMLDIISNINSGNDIEDSRYLLRLSQNVLDAVEKLNYQSYKSIKAIMEGLSGKKISSFDFPNIDTCVTVVNNLSEKRHEYVHRMGVHPLAGAAGSYSGPVTQRQLDALIDFSDYLIQLFD